MKVYIYAKCGTCRKAVKFLESQGAMFEVVPIREQPPTRSELKAVLAYREGNLKKLFNTSGGDYREQKLGVKLPSMSEGEALDLLTSNGNLVKRPVLVGKGIALNGFREDEWSSALG